jgi:hypothetical protein
MMILLLPILYILYLNSVSQINGQNGQNKQCTNCKYFVPHKNNKITSLGLCKMFGNKVYSKDNEKINYNFAEHCRNDESLCGKNATFYEEQNKSYFVEVMEDEMMKRLINDYYNFLRNENDW